MSGHLLGGQGQGATATVPADAHVARPGVYEVFTVSDSVQTRVLNIAMIIAARHWEGLSQVREGTPAGRNFADSAKFARKIAERLESVDFVDFVSEV